MAEEEASRACYGGGRDHLPTSSALFSRNTVILEWSMVARVCGYGLDFG